MYKYIHIFNSYKSKTEKSVMHTQTLRIRMKFFAKNEGTNGEKKCEI